MVGTGVKTDQCFSAQTILLFKQISPRTFRSFILVIIRLYNYSFTFNYSALFEQKKCLRTDTLTFYGLALPVFISASNLPLYYIVSICFFWGKVMIVLSSYTDADYLALLCYIGTTGGEGWARRVVGQIGVPTFSCLFDAATYR